MSSICRSLTPWRWLVEAETYVGAFDLLVRIQCMCWFLNFWFVIMMHVNITWINIMSVCVCLYSCFRYPTCKSHLFCAVLYCHLWPVWFYHVFPYYLITGTIFGKKKLLHIKCVFWLSLQLLSETSLILRRIQHIIIHLQWSSCKVPGISNLNLPDRISQNPQIPNFMKIRQVGAELFHMDSQTVRQPHMTKIRVTFRSFVNAPTKVRHACSRFFVRRH
jgi:hypothetical protein